MIGFYFIIFLLDRRGIFFLEEYFVISVDGWYVFFVFLGFFYIVYSVFEVFVGFNVLGV